MISEVRTKDAPTPGHYSQGVLVDLGTCRQLYVSGMTADFPERAKIDKCDAPDDIKRQTKRCIENLLGVVRDVGGTIENIAQITVQIVDMEKNFDPFNEAYEERFKGVEVKPARMPIAIEKLPWEGYLVMMDAVAYIPKE